MSEPKKLIEVAMPIKEISAESVRDKSIRHGHISTLHLWWARRPLPVCRAVVFASLVPDPLDENCPQSFKDAVEILLGSSKNPLKEIGIPNDAFKPYEDIPFTAAIDKMEDTGRNRLMMFIGKFSNEYSINEKVGKVTPTAKLINPFSLIKSENKDNEIIIGKARRLIWVAFNAKNGNSAINLLSDFELHYDAIKKAEIDLYNTTDRHIDSIEVNKKETDLKNAIQAFLNKMPKVFDPFAGGGAIPLEAARLGCNSFGNDINPVAHIIQKGSLEYPQKFGKPITYSKEEFTKMYGKEEYEKQKSIQHAFSFGISDEIKIKNRLAFDVEFYVKKLLIETENDIGKFYPANNKGIKPVAYYWVKVGKCSNPSCSAEVPLLKQFYISKRRSASEKDWVYFSPIIHNEKIDFEIKKGKYESEGWNNRGNLKCPICSNITDVKEIKRQSKEGILYDRMIAVIEENKDGKIFRVPSEEEINAVNKIPKQEIPDERIQKNSAGGDTLSWGITKWGEMYSNRQLLVMHTLIKNKNENLLPEYIQDKEYRIAISTYLAFLIDRVAMRNTRHNTWHLQQDTIEKVFGRQAISMVFDYPEMNPFSSFTSSAYSQLEQIINYIKSESSCFNISICQNAASGDKSQFKEKYLDVVVTDPPYYDAIAYADLSDFFYIWMKRTLFKDFSLNFATPQTPKTDECTALKHHHQGDYDKAKEHFEFKLYQIFDAIESQTKELVTIMFAHQSTEAWTTLCNSILKAKMNITGSWAIETENTGGLKQDKSFLASSVTVSCTPAKRNGLADYKEVKKAIEITVEKEVSALYSLGFRGADLLTACFGQAVSEFGKYEKVEKADGSIVTVAELLEMARESAFNALLKGFDGDDFTKFYIGWLQLNGLVENNFDDAAKFTKVGLSINIQDLFKEHILIKNGNKQHLGSMKERVGLSSRIGDSKNSTLIDQAHKLMFLYSQPNRIILLKYIEVNLFEFESPVWRVLTSLAELLPKDIEDHKLAVGLLTNKNQLIREAKSSNTPKPEQSKLILE